MWLGEMLVICGCWIKWGESFMFDFADTFSFHGGETIVAWCKGIVHPNIKNALWCWSFQKSSALTHLEHWRLSGWEFLWRGFRLSGPCLTWQCVVKFQFCYVSEMQNHHSCSWGYDRLRACHIHIYLVNMMGACRSKDSLWAVKHCSSAGRVVSQMETPFWQYPKRKGPFQLCLVEMGHILQLSYEVLVAPTSW